MVLEIIIMDRDTHLQVVIKRDGIVNQYYL